MTRDPFQNPQEGDLFRKLDGTRLLFVDHVGDHGDGEQVYYRTFDDTGMALMSAARIKIELWRELAPEQLEAE